MKEGQRIQSYQKRAYHQTVMMFIAKGLLPYRNKKACLDLLRLQRNFPAQMCVIKFTLQQPQQMHWLPQAAERQGDGRHIHCPHETLWARTWPGVSMTLGRLPAPCCMACPTCLTAPHQLGEASWTLRCCPCTDRKWVSCKCIRCVCECVIENALVSQVLLFRMERGKGQKSTKCTVTSLSNNSPKRNTDSSKT